MRVLFAALHYGQLRNFESVIADLSRRGHEIVVVAEEQDSTGGQLTAEALVAAHKTVRLGHLPDLTTDATVDLGMRLRVSLDYFRFHEPPYDRAVKLRERQRDRIPRLLIKGGRGFGRSRMTRWLVALERGLPPSQLLVRWLQAERPDVILLGSLTHYRSAAPEIHRAAAVLGIPVVACIYSWDHLSSKALLRQVPDRILVWNETQAVEAVGLHAMPRDRITVTGAQCYDQWFGRHPSRSHAQFCLAVGLNPDRLFLLYVCSALTPSPNEPGFVLEWIQRIRQADHGALGEIGILIRPHPERLREWDDVNIQTLDNVSVKSATDLYHDAKQDYFDALSHAAAVVGLVTSAFLDAAIVGRPVLTITLPQFAIHQHDMQHFRYLLDVADGLPFVARDLAEHITQLTTVLDGDQTWQHRQARFLEAFVRPHGLDRMATPVFVDAVVSVAGRSAADAPPRPHPSLAGAVASWVSQIGRIHRSLLDEQEWRRFRGLRQKAAVKRQRARARQRRQITGAIRRLFTSGTPQAGAGS